MMQDWKFFAKVLALPVFLYLCLDFLYRLSAMNVLRDAWFSFAFLMCAGVSSAVILGFLFAAATQLLTQRGRALARHATAMVSIWFLFFLFLLYLKLWIFSFTFADEMGTFSIRGRYVFAFSILAVAIPAAIAGLRGAFRALETFFSGVSRRMSRLAAVVAAASFITVGFALFQASVPAHAGEAPSELPKRANVFLLVVDTLGARHFSAYDSEAAPTPHFDRWTKEGLFFQNARTDVTSTGPSISSILTGKSPIRSHVLGYHPVPGGETEENLMTYLEAKNYETESIVDLDYASVAFHGWPTPTLGESLAYLPPRIDSANRWMSEIARRLRFSLKFRIPEVRTRELARFPDALQDLTACLKKRSRGPRPLFLYAHLYLPSRIVPNLGPPITLDTYPRRYAPEEQTEIDLARRDYDRTVSEWDAALGGFLDRLKAEGVLDTTIVVITADHGESFERGFWGHGDDLSEDSIRIPLLILAPLQKGRTIATPFLNSDIGPTLLDLLALPKPAWMDGISALAGGGRTEAVTFNNLIRTPVRIPVAFPGLSSGRSIALYRNGEKFIERPDGLSDELYDLSKDPDETRNIASWEKEKAEAMKRRLTETLSASQRP